MSVVFLQVMTTIILAILTLRLAVYMRKHSVQEGAGEPLWFVYAARTGMAKKRFFNNTMCDAEGIPQGSMIAGNRIWDDLYIDSAGERVKLLINAQNDKLFVSVLKGSIKVEQYEYHANKKARISIPEYTKLVLEDIELTFKKRRWQT